MTTAMLVAERELRVALQCFGTVWVGRRPKACLFDLACGRDVCRLLRDLESWTGGSIPASQIPGVAAAVAHIANEVHGPDRGAARLISNHAYRDLAAAAIKRFAASLPVEAMPSFEMDDQMLQGVLFGGNGQEHCETLALRVTMQFEVIRSFAVDLCVIFDTGAWVVESIRFSRSEAEREVRSLVDMGVISYEEAAVGHVGSAGLTAERYAHLRSLAAACPRRLPR